MGSVTWEPPIEEDRLPAPSRKVLPEKGRCPYELWKGWLGLVEKGPAEGEPPTEDGRLPAPSRKVLPEKSRWAYPAGEEALQVAHPTSCLRWQPLLSWTQGLAKVVDRADQA